MLKMATGNIDYAPSKELNHFSEPRNFNIFNSPVVLDINSDQNHVTMQPTIPSKIDSVNFDEIQTTEGLTSQLLNDYVQHPVLDNNKNSNSVSTSYQNNLMFAEQNKSGKTVEGLSSQLMNDCAQYPVLDSNKNCSNSVPSSPNQDSLLFGNNDKIEDNENLPSQGEFAKSFSCPLFQMQKPMPEELFINVESDDEGVHSWRPNVSSDSLCSDFFMTPALIQGKMDVNVSLQTQIKDVNIPSFVNWYSEFQNQPLQWQQESSDNLPISSIVYHHRPDIERHMHLQMINFNTVRYELMKARRRVNELKEEIKTLTQNLEAKRSIQKALGIEKLKEENTQLRLECQCLCMEVDYYLKGKAPLGEVEEKFYQGNASSEKKPGTQGNVPATHQSSHCLCNDVDNQVIHCNCKDDQEDCRKWECQKCTFANHPAINSCEMCNTPRLRQEHIPYAAALNNACFCHPRKNS